MKLQELENVFRVNSPDWRLWTRGEKVCEQVGTGEENYQACCVIEKDTEDGMKLISFGDPLKEKLEVIIKCEISKSIAC